MRQIWIARAAIVLSNLFLWLALIFGMPGSLVARAVLSLALGAIFLAGMVCFGRVISQCVARIPDARLSHRIKVDSLQIGMLLGVAPAMLLLNAYLDFVAPVVMTVLIILIFWYLWRMNACERALRQVVKLSRGE